MDNLNNTDFYTENNWQNISTPVVKSEEHNSQLINEEVLVKEKTKKHNKHPVLSLQLTLVLCVLLFLFVLKFLGTPVFDTIMSWYKEETSKSVLFSGNFESLDFSTIFATADES